MGLKAVEVFVPGAYPQHTYVMRKAEGLQTLRDSLSTPGQVVSLTGPSKSGKTVLVEMADPTPSVIDAIIESHIRPHAQASGGIVADLLGPGISPRQIGLAASSIAGQCLFYFHCRDTIRKLQPVLHFDAQDPLTSLPATLPRFRLPA